MPVLTVDIYETDETGQSELVVRHQFPGQSEDECLATLAAHKEADAFLRGCLDDGCYNQDVACTATYSWEP